MRQEGPLEDIARTLDAFARERDWEQFHTPKNLAMALAVEVAEIMEIFQWKTPAGSADLAPAEFDQLRDELADAFIYLLRLADRSGVDLAAAAREKIRRNHERYPAERVRGSAAKYTEYES